MFIVDVGVGVCVCVVMSAYVCIHVCVCVCTTCVFLTHVHKLSFHIRHLQVSIDPPREKKFLS